jgi:DNA-binding NtrC family response regulator
VTSGLSSNDNKKRILFVDDEPDLTSLFKKALESAGFSVNVFNNSADALREFKPHFYDLVMLDIIMPGIDGFELHKEIKKVDPLVKVCFLTASEKYRQELRNEEYCALNKDLFFQKPISIKDLIREVDKRIKSA